MKLSVVLATRNEEQNIGPCLESVRQLADEIIVIDEESTDRTREIAEKYGASVHKVIHEEIFHVNKQKALDLANGGWILQLDADERVPSKLADEIRRVISMSTEELVTRKLATEKQNKLFVRHQKLIEERDGPIGRKTGEVVAFFIPRRNFFLGKPLIHAGAYPDGVIRLIKRGKARFPAKSVHEQMEIDGEVGWIFKDLEHHDSPTLSRYLERMNRYTDLHSKELEEKKIPANYWNLFKYSFLLPIAYFLLLYVRHKGFLDGMKGFIWSLFSSLHYSIAYFKYWQTQRS